MKADLGLKFQASEIGRITFSYCLVWLVHVSVFCAKLGAKELDGNADKYPLFPDGTE